MLPTWDLAPHRESLIGMDAPWLTTESHSWAHPPHLGVYCAPHTRTELPWERSQEELQVLGTAYALASKAEEPQDSTGSTEGVTDCASYSARLYQGFYCHLHVMDYMNNLLLKFTFLAVDNQHHAREIEFCGNKKGPKILKYNKISPFFEKNVV